MVGDSILSSWLVGTMDLVGDSVMSSGLVRTIGETDCVAVQMIHVCIYVQGNCI